MILNQPPYQRSIGNIIRNGFPCQTFVPAHIQVRFEVAILVVVECYIHSARIKQIGFDVVYEGSGRYTG